MKKDQRKKIVKKVKVYLKKERLKSAFKKSHKEFKDHRKFKVISEALSLGYKKLANDFIKKFYFRDKTDLFYYFCKSGDIDHIKFMLENYRDDLLIQSIYYALFTECCDNNQKVVQFFLKQKYVGLNTVMTINEFESASLLGVACEANQIDIVKFLLNHKNIDINQKSSGLSILTIASDIGSIELVKLLLKRVRISEKKEEKNRQDSFDLDFDFGIQSFSDNPLYNACKNGHEEVIKLLLKNGALVSEAIINEVEKNDGRIDSVKNERILYYLKIFEQLNQAKSEVEFVLKKQREIRDEKDVLNLFLNVILGRSMQEVFDKIKKFEETLFYKLYQIYKYKQDKSLNNSFKSVFGVDLQDEHIKILKEEIDNQRNVLGFKGFYFDENTLVNIDKKAQKLIEFKKKTFINASYRDLRIKFFN